MHLTTIIAISLNLLALVAGHHDSGFNAFSAAPPHHAHHHSIAGPVGLTPALAKAAYNLPTGSTAGSRVGAHTIAIIDAYDSPSIASDLSAFSKQFSLPACTTANGCFEKVKMTPSVHSQSGWALEIALDVEWAHAISPGAKILLVEARSSSAGDLLAAVNYARNRSDVKAVSMSWGGPEFSGQDSYDKYFSSNFGAAFFAASGDSGAGVDWPAASSKVVGVGGTSLNLHLNPDGTFSSVVSETAWDGSGGGISRYSTEPDFQNSYGLNSNGARGVPDVSYDADPATGFAVYDGTSYQGQSGWWQVGGTSAGAPQWAAIYEQGLTAKNAGLYADAAGSDYAAHLRDITDGANGNCSGTCVAGLGYDFVTGLGSPLTINY
jgi:subtilase family serine protease